jgi:hypothetical protein
VSGCPWSQRVVAEADGCALSVRPGCERFEVQPFRVGGAAGLVLYARQQGAGLVHERRRRFRGPYAFQRRRSLPPPVLQQLRPPEPQPPLGLVRVELQGRPVGLDGERQEPPAVVLGILTSATRRAVGMRDKSRWCCLLPSPGPYPGRDAAPRRLDRDRRRSRSALPRIRGHPCREAECRRQRASARRTRVPPRSHEARRPSKSSVVSAWPRRLTRADGSASGPRRSAIRQSPVPGSGMRAARPRGALSRPRLAT